MRQQARGAVLEPEGTNYLIVVQANLPAILEHNLVLVPVIQFVTGSLESLNRIAREALLLLSHDNYRRID